MTPTTSGTKLDACIQACARCHDACARMAQRCLERGGDRASLALVPLLLDCAEICQTSANFMLRGSEHHAITCGACAEVCARCADECENARGVEGAAECAAVCRECADSCREMAGSAQHAASRA